MRKSTWVAMALAVLVGASIPALSAVITGPLEGSVPQAQADGSCSANSHRPVVISGNVHYEGAVICSESHMIFVEITLLRRTPGGGWVWVWDAYAGPVKAIALTARDKDPGYNCAKDYKVRTEGVVTSVPAGIVHTPVDNGNADIKFHTC